MKPAQGAISPVRDRVCLEICVDDSGGIAAAVSGGADRIELCSALALGGLTPSSALVAKSLDAGIPTHVLVRPRAGDFEYDEEELALITLEIRSLREAGVAGVVVGALNSSGRLNEPALERFRKVAIGLEVTLHRAIDLTPDQCEAVRIAADLGYDRILTSGGAKSAIEGAAAIRQMVEEAGSRLQIAAGGGITAANAPALVQQTGVTHIHASASRLRDWGDPKIEEFGFAAGPRRLTDAAKVAELKKAVASHHRSPAGG
jgi:copper homeostasis protein